MRALITATLAVVFVTTLGIAAFALGDDQRVPSSAPDAVATGMVRKLAANRAAETPPYLSSYAREQYTAARLTDWLAGIERTTGKISRISTADVTIGETLAATTLSVRGQKKTMQVRVNLVRESGTWKVERLPAIAD